VRGFALVLGLEVLEAAFREDFGRKAIWLHLKPVRLCIFHADDSTDTLVSLLMSWASAMTLAGLQSRRFWLEPPQIQ
jgi:hypothetical protein